MPGGKSVNRRARIWRSEDHLLLQARFPYVEEYKRFYFHDIQAVIVRKTVTGMVWNCLLSAALGVSVLAALAALARPADGPTGLMLIWPSIFMGSLVINVLMGPTCQCHLKTAATVQWLSMVVRMRTARRFIAALRPLVAVVQEDISPPEISDRLARTPPPAPVHILRRAGGEPPGPRRIVHYSGAVHVALFIILAASCAVNCAAIFAPNTLLAALRLGLLLAQLGCAIGALVKQSNSDIPTGLRATVWIVIGYVALVYIAAVVGGPVMAATDIDAFDDTAGPEIMLFTRIFEDQAMNVFSAVVTGILCMVGFVQLSAFHSEHTRRSRRAAVIAARQVPQQGSVPLAAPVSNGQSDQQGLEPPPRPTEIQNGE